MKPWSRLCCLVLVVCSASGGEDGATVSPGVEDLTTEVEGVNMTTSRTVDPSYDEAARNSSPGASAQSPASSTDAATTSADEGADLRTWTAHDPPQSAAPGPPAATVTVETNVTSTTATSPGDGGSSSWGYVMLVLILLVIVVLCVILYFLRKASKTYTFELQRQAPPTDLLQSAGTFEAVYLDDLERPIPKDLGSSEEPSPPAVTNGSLQLRGDGGDGGSDGSGSGDPQVVQTNAGETSPPGDGEGAVSGDDADADAAGGDPLGSIDPLLDQNENNNNPLCSSERFVEISLDDQLLSSPQAPSSVLPFSPFSF